MSSSVSSHPTHGLPGHTVWLARIFAAACVVAAVYFPVFDKANTEGAGLSIALVAGAVLVVVGLLALGRTSPWLSVALVTVGALVGGVSTVWTIVMPVAALALIVLFARGALRGSSVAAKQPISGGSHASHS